MNSWVVKLYYENTTTFKILSFTPHCSELFQRLPSERERDVGLAQSAEERLLIWVNREDFNFWVSGFWNLGPAVFVVFSYAELPQVQVSDLRSPGVADDWHPKRKNIISDTEIDQLIRYL